MKKIKTLLLLIIVFSAVKKADCQKTDDLTTLKYTVSEAPEWTNLLKRSSGWFGADGIYTIPLNGKANKQVTCKDKVLFIFSDSMIGEIKDGTLLPGCKMIHNSYAILSGSKSENSKIKFYWHTNKKGNPESVFIPKTQQTKPGEYFWLGAGFVNQEDNNNINIFGYRIQTFGNGAFDFKEQGNTLIKIKAGHLTDSTAQTQKDTPFFLEDKKDDTGGSFGAGFYVNTKQAGAPDPDGYIYVYGTAGRAKNLMVSRVLPNEFDDYKKWTFWDGANWNSDIKKSAALTDSVSNELSLSPLPDGRYALIFQINGISTIIGLRIGKTPYGPFGPVIKIWDCKKDMVGKDFFVYCAKGHPALSKPGELLISYNMNSFNFFKDLEKYPNLYRPRFIKIKFE
jgi:hypothetical protein